MKFDKPYQLQCWCPPTKNFEPLLDCDYETEEHGFAVFNKMLVDRRATGVRLVERKGVRSSWLDRVVVAGPMPDNFHEYIRQIKENTYEEN